MTGSIWPFARPSSGEDIAVHLIGDSTRVGDWCEHPAEHHRIVSDVVIETGIWNDSEGAHDYEVSRQIVACIGCGRVVDTPEVQRSKSW